MANWYTNTVLAVIAVIPFLLLGTLIYLGHRYRLDFQKWGSVPQAIATLFGVAMLAVGWVVTNQQSIERDLLTIKTQKASAIAEYAALAATLKDKDDEQTYRRANELSWQLFLWLPENVYRELGRGLANPHDQSWVESLLAVRKSLLGTDAGTLDADDIIVHAPGIRATLKPHQ
jgi:hypothetical protein